MNTIPPAVPTQGCVDALKELIGFDTTSRNSNLALIDWAADRLERAGATLRYDYKADKTKANLFATFGYGTGGVVLSGHTDVVPVDGQHWTTDPFAAALRDDKIYGRGACDMKAFIAVVLSQVSALGNAKLREPIHVALTYDEEMGCLGIPSLLADIRAAGIMPTGCIVGEPTDMRVIAAHKGGRLYRCRVKGRAAHASLTPRGVNAIEYASRIISHIQALADQETARGERDAGFDIPFSTISTNLISGGNGMNIVPASCEFMFEYRFLPGMSPEHFISSIEQFADRELLPRMKAVSADAGIEFERIGVIPALDAADTDEILKLALALSGQQGTGKVAYGSEASFYQEIGIPSILCGPGSIDQAHKPDEYVSLEQLAICESFLGKLITGMSG